MTDVLLDHLHEDESAAGPRCLFCASELTTTVVDLGMSPLCENFLDRSQLNAMEPFYPLHVYVCGSCWLVQVEEYVDPEGLFAVDYRYYSSYSESWLRHAETYVELATQRLGLGPDHLVVELGSNDGYLLQYFVQRGIPVLGIEPAGTIAEVANAKGVRTVAEFFGRAMAERLVTEGHRADLVVGNNVLAQVPDPNDFVAGIATLLSPGGTVTIEFPHLVRLVEENQYDTIYHEHFSYFSFSTVSTIFAAHGLTVFDVEELPSHGGSLRIWARHTDGDPRPLTERARELLDREEALGVRTTPHKD
jgi:SAM-dependent methyltransferase